MEDDEAGEAANKGREEKERKKRRKKKKRKNMKNEKGLTVLHITERRLIEKKIANQESQVEGKKCGRNYRVWEERNGGLYRAVDDESREIR